jgi:hypothetical protein
MGASIERFSRKLTIYIHLDSELCWLLGENYPVFQTGNIDDGGSNIVSTSDVSAVNVIRAISVTRRINQDAAQNKREAEEEFGVHVY